MGLFDNILFTTISRPSPIDLIPKSVQKKVEKTLRDKVDEYIHPDSDLGQMIEKKRHLEDKIEDLTTAPDNLSHSARKKEKDFNLADHLFIRIGLITHHAIYIGNGRVAHYSIDQSGAITIHEATIEKFSEGKEIQCFSQEESPLTYTPEEAVQRALKRIYEKEYNLLINNCEQYVRWCRCGRTK